MANLVFPQFDGSNPNLWIKHCETFFDVCDVDPHLWVRISTMHLTGSAALWLQPLVQALSWPDFGAAICACFDRDEQNHLLRHFFHIPRQTSVNEYIECFSDLIHHSLLMTQILLLLSLEIDLSMVFAKILNLCYGS